MAKHSVVLGKSQVSLIQLARDLRDQLMQGADNGFQQRVNVVAEEIGAPPNTRVNIVDGENGAICAEWDAPDIAPSAIETETASAK